MSGGESSTREELPKLPIPMLSVDVETGEITNVNPRLLDETHMDKTGVVGHKITEFMPKISDNQLRELFFQSARFALADEKHIPQIGPELNITLPDGTEKTVELAMKANYTSSPQPGRKKGKFTGFTVSLFDITRRTKDPLTELLNIKTFFQRGKELLAATHRENRSVVGIMTDADYFKKINDKHSHQTGDEVLQQISEILTAHAREHVDLVGRYGGEEFCMLMPDIKTPQNALDIADRLRADIALSRFTSENIPVTMSIGLVMSPPEQTYLNEPEVLLHYADLALLAAKKSGRNRIGLFIPRQDDEPAKVLVYTRNTSGELSISDTFRVNTPERGRPEERHLEKIQ